MRRTGAAGGGADEEAGGEVADAHGSACGGGWRGGDVGASADAVAAAVGRPSPHAPPIHVVPRTERPRPLCPAAQR